MAHHGNAAARVAQESGIPASFMLGQAGHETGWGKSEIKNADGSNAHNLFGIKAGKGWTGKVAEVTTTEYIDGVARKVTARFRAYGSYEESFRDYARLITSNPRYEKPWARPDRPWPMRPSCKSRLRHRPRVRQQAQPCHPERRAERGTCPSLTREHVMSLLNVGSRA